MSAVANQASPMSGATIPRDCLPNMSTDDLLDMSFPLPNLDKATIHQVYQQKWMDPTTGKYKLPMEFKAASPP